MDKERRRPLRRERRPPRPTGRARALDGESLRSSRLRLTRPSSLLLLLVLPLLLATAAGAQQRDGDAAAALAPVPTAPVVVDGVVLFRVRGVSAFPAEERAARIARRISEAARDPSVRPESVRIEDGPIGARIVAGSHEITTIVDADARLESVSRAELATVVLERTRQGIRDYRSARSRAALVPSGIAAAVATLTLVFLLWLLLWLWRQLDSLLDRLLRRHLERLEERSRQIVRAGSLWRGLRTVLRLVKTLGVLVLVYLYLRFTLGLFPWTRWISSRLAEWILGPLTGLARAALAQIPNLIFLAILFLVVRYALRLMRLAFEAIERGRLRFEGFDADWAIPTYKLVRLLVIAFSLVVAYPYIPGSGSAAFTGVSVFLGFVLSLGSSSAISNTIAGFLMTYRRAFRVGDRVQIDDTVGEVTEIRLQVTHLRTPKNEEVVIPNSTILSSPVKNYTTLARSHGLILHTTVGIGYETPWRQVEAMLLVAAERTPGLASETPPFVLQRELGDFAITYELNVHCHDPGNMWRHYSALHRNILDVFNEYGVAIMTPSYEADPPQDKVVPRERWYEPPAKRSESESGGGPDESA